VIRRVLAVGLAAALGLTVFGGVTPAHNANRGSLHISKEPKGPIDSGQQVSILGQVRPGACHRAGEQVTLHQRGGGVLGTDSTDGDGEFGFTINPTTDIKVFARWNGFTESSYDHSHRCKRDRSNIVPFNVR
jgi:hypothetical protein